MNCEVVRVDGQNGKGSGRGLIRGTVFVGGLAV
jgi:hypothetical protein